MRQYPFIYSQRNSQWSGQRLGTVNGTTIGSDGCYITCFAMAASSCGHTINPPQLDDLFTNNHWYYNSKGTHTDPANLLADPDLEKAFPDIKYQKTYWFSDIPADLNILKNLLADSGNIVILEVDFNHNPSDGTQTHFVIAKECDGQNVTIIDPWYGSTNDFKTHYGDNPKQTIIKYIVYRGNQVNMGGGGNMANMYKGYDLANPDSMKVAVDILVRVQNGEFVDKAKYDTLEREAIELRKRPVSCPPAGDPKATDKLNRINELVKNSNITKIQSILNE